MKYVQLLILLSITSVMSFYPVLGQEKAEGKKAEKLTAERGLQLYLKYALGNDPKAKLLQPDDRQISFSFRARSSQEVTIRTAMIMNSYLRTKKVPKENIHHKYKVYREDFSYHDYKTTKDKEKRAYHTSRPTLSMALSIEGADYWIKPWFKDHTPILTKNIDVFGHICEVNLYNLDRPKYIITHAVATLHYMDADKYSLHTQTRERRKGRDICYAYGAFMYMGLVHIDELEFGKFSYDMTPDRFDSTLAFPYVQLMALARKRHLKAGMTAEDVIKAFQ